MKIAIFFLAFFLSASAHAQYGYIRVIVPKLQPGHHWQVQLHANGRPIGPGFSHEGGGFGWQRLEKEHLNPNGTTTQIYASYGPLATNGCSFDFHVAFSMDGQTELMQFSNFKAPRDGNTGSIPLGLGCGKNGNRLCSSNSALQSKIAEQANAKAVERFNEWKREYDDRLSRRREDIRRQEKELAAEIAKLETPDFSSAEKILEAKVQEWEKETQRQQLEQAEREQGKQPAPEEGKPADLAKAAEQNVMGEAIVGAGTFHARLGEFIAREKDFQEASRSESSPTEIRQGEKAVADMEFVRRNVFQGDGFVHVMGEAAGLTVRYKAPSYVSSGITLCEITSGRKVCIGRKLSDEEIFVKACSLAIKHFPLWKRAREWFLSSSRTSAEAALGKQIERYFRHGGCKALEEETGR